MPERARRPLLTLRGMRSVWLAAIALAGPSPILAHDGPPPTPAGIWSAWNLDPFVLAALAVACALYLPGLRAVWRRAGRGKGLSHARVMAWVLGLLALVLALISPIDALGGALFSGHMVQHLLLVLVAAPLLVLGAPHRALAWSLPRRVRGPAGRWWSRARLPRALRRAIGNVAVVTALHALAMWAWHVPVLYEAALWHEGWHALEHASFLLTALLFWWMVVRSRRGAGVAVLAIFFTAMQSGILGAFLSLSSSAWYLGHGATVGQWGLTLMEDQQLAGMIMWIPASVVYIGAALAVLWRWLGADQTGAVPAAPAVANRPVIAPSRR